jgi:hypothetical protein
MPRLVSFTIFRRKAANFINPSINLLQLVDHNKNTINLTRWTSQKSIINVPPTKCTQLEQPFYKNLSVNLPQLVVALDKGLHILVVLLHCHHLPLFELDQFGVELLDRFIRE